MSITELPDELIQKVSLYLDLGSTCRFTQTCRAVRNAFDSCGIEGEVIRYLTSRRKIFADRIATTLREAQVLMAVVEKALARRNNTTAEDVRTDLHRKPPIHKLLCKYQSLYFTCVPDRNPAVSHGPHTFEMETMVVCRELLCTAVWFVDDLVAWIEAEDPSTTKSRDAFVAMSLGKRQAVHEKIDCLIEYRDRVLHLLQQPTTARIFS